MCVCGGLEVRGGRRREGATEELWDGARMDRIRSGSGSAWILTKDLGVLLRPRTRLGTVTEPLGQLRWKRENARNQQEAESEWL